MQGNIFSFSIFLLLRLHLCNNMLDCPMLVHCREMNHRRSMSPACRSCVVPASADAQRHRYIDWMMHIAWQELSESCAQITRYRTPVCPYMSWLFWCWYSRWVVGLSIGWAHAADAILSRANTLFRPRATLTLAEALGIVIKSLNISLSNTSTSTVSGPLPAWQKRIILTIQEKQIRWISEIVLDEL